MSYINSLVTAKHFAVSSGHGLATQAGYDILESGGNAIDAGVAAGIALAVLHTDLCNFAGVAPIILRMADTGKITTIDGLGTWPRAATVGFFEKEFGGEIPDGILRTIVPAAPAAWITALKEFGTMRFADVAAMAIQCASDGFPVYDIFADFIKEKEEQYRRTPENARIYLPNGRPPKVAETFIQSDLAATLQYMVDEEAAAKGSREDGLNAAYDSFYKGDIAQKICAYHRENNGFLTLADMADFKVRLEEPLHINFMGADFYTCGAWCQGISLAQLLGMLEHASIDKLIPNSAEHIHIVTEIMKLVFADREQYVADPAFHDVPIKEMLDAGYLASRLKDVNLNKAQPNLPAAGDPLGALGVTTQKNGAAPDTLSTTVDDHSSPSTCADTTYVCAIDADGNMFSATPSDTSFDTDVIPGTGLCPSSRGSQSRGYADHINALAPGKRPRLTPNPALALKDGKPFMTFGTPGGDVQIQVMAQVVSNVLCYGMDIQGAIEAPRFSTYSFPSSFAPHTSYPGLLKLEQRIGHDIGDHLKLLGHKVEWWDDWTWLAGGVCAIVADTSDEGYLYAGADPRRAGLALGK